MTEALSRTIDRPAHRKSRRGMLVCVAMFALGGLVLWGLFQAPRNRPPVAPAVPWGAPARPLRFVSLECGGQRGVSDDLCKEVRDLDPDFVLVQNILFADVLPLAERLGMAKSFHPSLFQRSDPRSKDTPGDLILSVHPLYDGGRIDLDEDVTRNDAHGVRAVAAVDGSRFLLASGLGTTDRSRQAFDAYRRTTGAAPTVLATGFLRGRRDEGDYAGDLIPTVAPTQEAEGERRFVRVAGIFVDRSWLMVRGATVGSAAGAGLVLEVELKASPAASASTVPER